MEFHETVGDEDYALIISEDGSLKGLWIPRGKRGEELPFSIRKICMEYYGVDPAEEMTEPPILH